MKEWKIRVKGYLKWLNDVILIVYRLLDYLVKDCLK